MKKIYLATGLSLALAVPAMSSHAVAADMSPPRMYTKATPAASPSPAFDWSGFYAGAHLGYDTGRAHVLDNGVLVEDHAPMNGLVGGALAGYNWQTGVFVVGLEGDFGVSGLLGHGSLPPVALPNQYNVDFSGNLRGRIGISVLPTTLIYAAGGLAVANFDFRDGSAPVVKTNMMTGWTVGGGIDQAFNKNLIGRVEYLYSDYGHKDFTLAPDDIYNVGFKTQTVRGALIWKFDPSSSNAYAADLGARPYTKAPMMAPVSTWTGFYTGFNVGYGWGSGNDTFTAVPNVAAIGELNSTVADKQTGAIGGVQIGYNWQMASFVTGLEADIQGSGIRGSTPHAPVLDEGGVSPFPTSFRSSDQKLSWFGTVRGRVGVAVVPDLLFYGTGGLAYGQVQGSAESNPADFINQYISDFSGMKAGWTAGGGAEWKFAHNWSAKAEYLYIDLGSVSARSQSTSASFAAENNGIQNSWQVRDHIVRVGVNYHIN
jgi:outer membrane immunogenic protein